MVLLKSLLRQIFAFLSPSDSEMQPEKLLYALKGTQAFQSDSVEKIFKSFGGDISVPLYTLYDKLNGDKFPEVREGIIQFAAGYSEDNETLSISQFVNLHGDMYSSSPQNYGKVFNELW